MFANLGLAMLTMTPLRCPQVESTVGIFANNRPITPKWNVNLIIFAVMKLRGGKWSKGDAIAFAGLIVTAMATTLTVPELRRWLGLDPIPFVHKEKTSVDSAAFRLGKAVTTLSFWVTETSNSKSDSNIAEWRQFTDEPRADIRRALTDLSMVADIDHLDFTSKDYKDSPASVALQAQITLKYGPRVGDIFSLGVKIQGSLWLAEFLSFRKAPENSFQPIETIKDLNEDARKFGVGPVSISEIESADGYFILNHEMRSQVKTLDGRFIKLFSNQLR